MEVVKQKERKLTAQEEKRKIQFMKLQEEMQEKGYKGEHITISALKANVMALVVTLPIICCCLIVYKIICERPLVGISSLNGFELLIFFAMYIVGIVIHELIHGITWARYCKKGWKAIDFGVIWEYLTPYCTCDEGLTYKQYKIGALMPTLILGGVSYLIALMLGNDIIFLYSLLMILGGGGDIYIITLICRHKGALFVDHPYLIGCMAFKKTESNNEPTYINK